MSNVGSFLDDNPAVGTLGLSAGMGAGAYLLARLAKRKGARTKPLLTGLTAASLPFLYTYLARDTPGTLGYNADRFGVGAALTNSTSSLLNSKRENTDRYVKSWLKSLPVDSGYVPRLPDDMPLDRVYSSHLPKTNVLGNTPLRGTDDAIRNDSAVYTLMDRIQMMRKKSGYSPMIDLSHATSGVLNDRFLTPEEKRSTLAILHGGSNLGAGKGLLSTGDVVQGAIGAGLGSLAAKYVGTVVGGVFGGLKPDTLRRVQNAGALAGMLRGTGVWK